MTESMFSRLAPVATLAAFALVAGMVWLNLDAGYELGDNGYYLLHVRQPDQLTHVVTQFGYAWQAFLGEHGIRLNRALNAALIIASGVVLAKCLQPAAPARSGLSSWVRPALAGAGAYATYFASFIIDPSYNSLTLILLSLILAVAAILLKGFNSWSGWKLGAWGAATGVLVAALVLTKITSALFVSVYLAGAFAIAAVSLRERFRLVPLILGGLVGAVAFFLWLAIRGVSLVHVYDSFRDGYHAFSMGGAHSSRLVFLGVAERLIGFVRYSVSAVRAGGWMMAVPAVAAMCLSLAAGGSAARFRPLVILLNLAVLAVAVALCVRAAPEATLRSCMLTLFNIGGLAAVILLIRQWRDAGTPLALAWLGAILLPLFAAVGTINGYADQAIYLGAGLPMLPAFVIAATSSCAAVKRCMEVTLFTLLASVMMLSAVLMHQFPYRIAGTLADATIPEAMPDGEVIRVTPPVAAFMDGLRPQAYRGPYSERPMIFDMTEQLPLSVILLNGRPAGAAWFAGVMNKAFSTEVFASLRDEDVLNGWILVQDAALQGEKPMTHFSSLVDRLQKMGVRFEDHYVKVATATAPNWGDPSSTIRVSLFKPLSQP